VADKKVPDFIPADWAVTPSDTNDRMIGQLVTAVLEPSGVDRPDVICFGLPFDGAVLGRAGAVKGPNAIRASARSMKAFNFESGELKKRIFDLGDVRLPADDVHVAHEEAEKAARLARKLSPLKKSKSGARIIALGGDHSLTYPCCIPYLEEFGDRLAVINLDAHLDVRSVGKAQPFNSGTSFSRLIEKKLKHYTVIGARDFQTSPAYIKRAAAAGTKIISAGEVHDKGAAAVAREVLAGLPPKCAAIYLSVDVDVADASVAPGVSAPTPGGLLAHQVFQLVRLFCADGRVRACDIMELAPPLEEPHSDRTTRLAAGCLAEMLATA
jgi:formiminoglutamase